MKFSYNWIREFVPSLDAAPGPLERLITMKTAECEGIEVFGEFLDRACAARVESVEAIPGAHNLKAIVDAGRYGRKTLVCGAPNCRAGIVTAYVPLGKKVINGIESDGMLASAAELGINKDDDGIIELDMQVGAPLPGCIPDSIIDIDNKSITHRPDLWGHHGMAREVAAIFGAALTDPVDLSRLPAAGAPIKIEIEDYTLCPRYSALVFENVTVRPSPLWLQCRLTAIGLNPINNIVDVTNYIMSELAQPMHAFDADRLQGDTIFVRRAHASESFAALNDESYTLHPTNLVIADAGGAIALAGVIGGKGSAISDTTTRIVLESANFQAASVRKTSAAVKLRTDASMRFEKAQDPANTVRALARALDLLEQVSPGIRLVGGLGDARGEVTAPAPIELPLDWLNRKLGRAIPPSEVQQILERLAFTVTEPRPGVFSVTVPSWRATKDIAIKDDLVEEVGRMVGYDSITPQPPLVPTVVPPRNEQRPFEHAVTDLFLDLGCTEVQNYSFLSEEAVAAFGLEPAAHVRVSNPIASDQALMRQTLLPGIWKNINENLKHRESFRIFEIGQEVHKQSEGLPVEVPHLAAAIYDRSGDGAAGLFDLKRAAECLMPGAEVRPTTARAFEHPARAAEIVWKGEVAGRLFEFHPSHVETGRAAVLDLDLAIVRRLSTRDTRYQAVRRYPSSAFDLSIIAAARDYAGTLEAAIVANAGPLLESVKFVREYSGPPLESGQKSVSFRLTVGSPERTLSSDEINGIRAKIIEGMQSLGYVLRV